MNFLRRFCRSTRLLINFGECLNELMSFRSKIPESNAGDEKMYSEDRHNGCVALTKMF